MSYRHIIDRLTRRAEVADAAHAEHLLASTLPALAEQLGQSACAQLRLQLPQSLHQWLQPEHAGPPVDDIDAIADRISREAKVPPGRALEQLQIVAQALADALPSEHRSRLLSELPAALARLFTRRASQTEPISPQAIAGRGRTLATGRPGGRNPLAEASQIPTRGARLATGRPGGAHPVSDSHGGPPDGETLATGRAGGSTPLSEGKPPRK